MLLVLAALAQTPQVIPAPQHFEAGDGAFAIGRAVEVTTTPEDDPELARLARLVAQLLGGATDARGRSGGREVKLRIDPAASSHPEGYRLIVTHDSITVSARTGAGIFYGIQTLAQLVPGDRAGAIPSVSIRDTPRFGYRGMHLDVGRHFFPTEFVKKYIDLIAMYKMNTFHWHLTEDQGWRIEIKRYPRLTEVGAYRAETMVARNFDPYVGDGTPHGGFYTQDEIRDIVAYAAERYVTIIPEIEMPGHALAALASYPEYACTDGPFEVGTIWGVYEDIYCPTEETFAFLEHVLDEVMGLFPGTYIHVGGDEAPKTRWEESAVAQAVIRREGLSDEHELQSYFIQRIERYLTAHGRRLIGWDEILEGGLASQATVMSWRGTDGGIEAARMGHDVIMAPNSDVYFDYYQSVDRTAEPLAIGGYTPLDDVYAFEPIPDELSETDAQYILGAQGQLWTEYIKTEEHAEYMVLPRMVALAEVLWSPKATRDWESFLRRLPNQFRKLDSLGYNYRVPDVEMGLVGRTGRSGQAMEDLLTLENRVTVMMEAPVDGQIRYTTDPSLPTMAWPAYRAPVELRVDTGAVTVYARLILDSGKPGALRSTTFRKATLRPSEAIDASAVIPGLEYEYFEGELTSVNQITDIAPTTRGIATNVAFQGVEREEQFGLAFTGFFRAEEDGIYRFTLTSDDGSRFWLANVFRLDNDGLHGTMSRSGSVALARGFHPIHIRYFQAGGGRSLRLSYQVDGGDERTLSQSLFRQP